MTYNVPPKRARLTTCLIDDELQNVEMAEAERTQRRNELKIKRREYTGYDDDEFIEGREGMKTRILSKYDEFLEGPKETVSVNAVTLSRFSYLQSQGFRLGGSIPSTRPGVRIEEQAAAPINKALLTIDYTSTLLPSLFTLALISF